MNETGEEPTNKLTCTVCHSTNITIDYRLAEVVCDDCGMVQENALIYAGEGTNFGKISSQSDPNLPKNFFYTATQNVFTDISGVRDSGSTVRSEKESIQNISRLKKWHKRLKMINSSDRNLSFALGELTTICTNLSLSLTTTIKATDLYRTAVRNNVIRGRSVEGVIAASIYAASRITDTPRTLDELSNIAGVTKKEIGRTYRFLMKTLALDIPTTTPASYIPRFCSILHLDREVLTLSKRIIAEIYDEKLYSGRGPIGICAATIYLAADFLQLGKKITQKEISAITGVTEVTIRNRYKEIQLSLNERSIEQGYPSLDAFMQLHLRRKDARAPSSMGESPAHNR